MNCAMRAFMAWFVLLFACFASLSTRATDVSIALSEEQISVTVGELSYGEDATLYLVWDTEDKGTEISNWANHKIISDSVGGDSQVYTTTWDGVDRSSVLRAILTAKIELIDGSIAMDAENEYVDTGVEASNIYGVEVGVTMTGLGSAWHTLLGTKIDSFTVGCVGASKDRLYIRYGGNNNSSGREVVASMSLGNTICNDIVIRAPKISCNGTVYTTSLSESAPVATDSYNLHLGTDGARTRRLAYAKWYYARVYGSGGVLLRNYLPAKNGTCYGFYEAVSKSFTSSSGGGEFTSDGTVMGDAYEIVYGYSGLAVYNSTTAFFGYAAQTAEDAIWNHTSTTTWTNESGVAAAFGVSGTAIFEGAIAEAARSITLGADITVADIVIDTDDDITLSGAYSFNGSGALIKGGNGTFTWDVTGTLGDNYDILITNGIFKIGNSVTGHTLASTDASKPITIKESGTLDLNLQATGANIDHARSIHDKVIYVEGEGYNRQGAIINSGSKTTAYLGLGEVVLTGDTLINVTGRMDFNPKDFESFRANNATTLRPCLDGEDYVLTISSPDGQSMEFNNSDLNVGSLWLTNDVHFGVAASSKISVSEAIHLKDLARLYTYAMSSDEEYQINDPIVAESGTLAIYCASGAGVINGQITVKSDAELSLFATSGKSLSFNGAIENNGTLRLVGGIQYINDDVYGDIFVEDGLVYIGAKVEGNIDVSGGAIILRKEAVVSGSITQSGGGTLASFNLQDITLGEGETMYVGPGSDLTGTLVVNGGTIRFYGNSPVVFDGLSTLAIGELGVTFDTGDKSVSVCVPHIVTFGPLTKQGSGTLTIDRAFYGNTIVVNEGDVKLVAGETSHKGVLAHRYRFDGNLVDEVLGTESYSSTNNISFSEDGKAVMFANSKYSALNFPQNLLPSSAGECTFELWVTVTGVSAWCKMLYFGSYSFYAVYLTAMHNMADYCSAGAYIYTSANNANWINAAGETTTSAFIEGTRYHLACTLKVRDDGRTTDVYWTKTNLDNAEDVVTMTYKCPWSLVADAQFICGFGAVAADPSPEMRIDEFRVWNAVMTETAIQASIAAGPDTLPEVDFFKPLTLACGEDAASPAVTVRGLSADAYLHGSVDFGTVASGTKDIGTVVDFEECDDAAFATLRELSVNFESFPTSDRVRVAPAFGLTDVSKVKASVGGVECNSLKSTLYADEIVLRSDRGLLIYIR